MTSKSTAVWASLGSILLLWTFSTIIGGAGGYYLTIFGFSLGDPENPQWLAAALIFGAAIGGFLAGGGQWWVMNSLKPISKTWVLATVAGWGFGIPVAVLGTSVARTWVSGWSDGAMLATFLLVAGGAGMLAALWQWFILKQHFRRAGWWPVASGIGWSMAWLVILALGLLLSSGSGLPVTLERGMEILILGAAAGFVVGFEQGIAVIGITAEHLWQQKRPVPDSGFFELEK